jgi:3-oxo-5-alpha-steroid 4-dehydrogenase 1
MFLLGFYWNNQADAILRGLRKPGETGYKIPYGGMFEYVSGANFFAETFEWLGFAIASSALGGLAFFVVTAANIVTRAVAHHKWYLEKFKGEYPKNRKAVIPFIW